MRPYRKKRDLANWIRRKLGSPVIDVVLDSTQLDDCIDQATDFFGEHAGGIGNEDTIIAICPELVLYDGTGTICQPGPTGGRWRKRVGTIPTTAAPTTGEGCPIPENSLIFKYGGPDGNPLTSYPVLDASGSPCPGETLPGPGWCGTGIQDAHCFIETDPTDPEAIGPFWVEGDTPVKPAMPGFIFKSIYDVPTDIIAVHDNLQSFPSGLGGSFEDNALFFPQVMMFQGGGSWGLTNSATYSDNRWGYWQSGANGYVDIVSMFMGMQTLELYRQMFTIKVTAQLMDLDHKVRINPGPKAKGTIVFGATRRVADESMYSHQWVREYAFALAMQQVGMNMSKYGNITMPGGGSINGELYLTRGDALREKLEAQIKNDSYYSEPPDFFVG